MAGLHSLGRQASSYEWANGPSGTGVSDFFGPEINSVAVPLNMVGYNVPSCHTLPDPTATDDWTVSFQNIQCYDKLHVQAILNQIDGKNHDGSRTTQVPKLFGANLQAVSVGQKAGGEIHFDHRRPSSMPPERPALLC